MNLSKKTILISFIAICVVVFIIVSIINNNNNTKTNQNLQKTEIQQKNTTNQDTTNNQVVETKLSISEKCIGCGKCARIDSEHFYTQGNGSKSKIISFKNLDSSNLKTAIAMCPVGAINLN